MNEEEQNPFLDGLSTLFYFYVGLWFISLSLNLQMIMALCWCGMAIIVAERHKMLVDLREENKRLKIGNDGN